jgi:hypothetical protein
MRTSTSKFYRICELQHQSEKGRAALSMLSVSFSARKNTKVVASHGFDRRGTRMD